MSKFNSIQSKPQLLLIDDDDEFVKVMLKSFSNNYEIEVIKDFEQVTDEVIGKAFDLVLVDIYDKHKKPVGKEIIKRIKLRTKLIPVIAVTIDSAVALAMETKTLGADHHLAKVEYNSAKWDNVFKQHINKKLLSVFISYSWKDKVFVEYLKKSLEEKGMNVWIDDKNLKGQSIMSKPIADGIINSDFFMVVLSPNAVNSKWVPEEVEFALNEKNKKQIIPVFYQECNVREFNFRLANLRSIDLRYVFDEVFGEIYSRFNLQ